MANTIKKTTISYNISRNNNYNVPSVENNEFVNSLDASSNNVENFDLNDAVDNSYDNDDNNVTYELNSDTSTESINDSSSSNIQESYSDNGNGTTEVNNSNSSRETDVNSVQNGVDSARSNNSNSKTNSEASVSSSQTGVGAETDNNKTNSGTTTSSVPNGVDSATINSNKNSNNNEMSQSSMNDGNGVGTSSNSGTPPIGAYDNNPPVAGENYPNSGTSSSNSSSDGKSSVSNVESENNQNINDNDVSSSSGDNVNSSGNNPDGPWIILTDEEYLKMYQELLDSIEKQIGTDGEISVLLREIRLKYVDYTIMDVNDGMDEKRLNEQIEQQIQAKIDKVDQYVREHSDYNSYAELMQSKAEFEADKAACEQMIKYYTDKPIWEEYYNKLEIAKKEMPPQTGIVGKRGLKGDPINKIHRIDSYEEQLIELFGENYKEVLAQYGLDLDFDYVQLYNYIYEYEGPIKAEEFYEFAEDNIKSLAGLVDALEETSLLSKDKWYSTAMNFITAHLEGMGTGVVSSFEGVMQWFDENPSKTETDYQSMWYLLMLQTNEFGPEGALSLSYQVGQGTGQMLPSIAISIILGAVCPESLALPMGIALKGSTIAEFGASAYLFASTGGRDYAEQMQNGMSRDQAILHGIATGGLDVTTEKLLGGLSVFGHDSPYNIKQLVISMAKEGGQEVAQDVLSELLHLGGELPNFESKEEAIEYFKEKGMTFLVAALSAGEIEGPMTAASIRNISDIYNNYLNNPNIDVTEAELANLIRNSIDEDTSKMSDAEVIGKYNQQCINLLTREELKKQKTIQEVANSRKDDNFHAILASLESLTNYSMQSSSTTIDPSPDAIYTEGLIQAALTRASDYGTFYSGFTSMSDFDKLDTILIKLNENHILDAKTIKSYQDQVQTVKKNFVTHFSHLLFKQIKSSNLKISYFVDNNYGMVFTGLEPNREYNLKYEYTDQFGIKLESQVIVRTNAQGYGLIQEFYRPQIITDDLAKGLSNGCQFTGIELSGPQINQENYNALLGADYDRIGIDQGVFEPVYGYYNFFNRIKRLLSINTVDMQLLSECKDIVKEYHPTLSDKDAVLFLSKIDHVEGACTYASVCNMILTEFKDDPQLFKNIFGYDMYRTLPNGQKVLNSELLMADLYTFANKDNLAFFIDDLRKKLGNKYELKTIYRNPATPINQIYLSGLDFFRDDIIEEFLKYKCSKNNQSYDVTLDTLELTDIKQIDINNGSYQIIVYFSDNPGFRMYYINPKTGIMDNVYEKEGQFNHVMEIVTKSDTGIYVVSWGEYYFIPYSSLSNVTYKIDKINIDINEQ